MTSQARIIQEVGWVLEECAKWGVLVKVRPHPLVRAQGETTGADGFGCHYESATVLLDSCYWEPQELDEQYPCALFHEAVHCIVSKEPERTSEIADGMLAIEWELAERFGLRGAKKWFADWSILAPASSTRICAWNLTSIQYDPLEWSSLRPRERRVVLGVSFFSAYWAGLLTREGNPTYKSEAVVTALAFRQRT